MVLYSIAQRPEFIPREIYVDCRFACTFRRRRPSFVVAIKYCNDTKPSPNPSQREMSSTERTARQEEQSFRYLHEFANSLGNRSQPNRRIDKLGIPSVAVSREPVVCVSASKTRSISVYRRRCTVFDLRFPREYTRAPGDPAAPRLTGKRHRSALCVFASSSDNCTLQSSRSLARTWKLVKMKKKKTKRDKKQHLIHSR